MNTELTSLVRGIGSLLVAGIVFAGSLYAAFGVNKTVNANVKSEPVQSVKWVGK